VVILTGIYAHCQSQISKSHIKSVLSLKNLSKFVLSKQLEYIQRLFSKEALSLIKSSQNKTFDNLNSGSLVFIIFDETFLVTIKTFNKTLNITETICSEFLIQELSKRSISHSKYSDISSIE